MPKVVRVKTIGHYQLFVEFDDGTSGEIDIADRIFGPAFEPLLDESEFNRVMVDEFGAIAWPCGADLAPDAVYQRLRTGVSV